MLKKIDGDPGGPAAGTKYDRDKESRRRCLIFFARLHRRNNEMGSQLSRNAKEEDGGLQYPKQITV